MIAKRLSELQRCRQSHPKEFVAATIMCMKDQLRTIGRLSSTTVGTSPKEELIEWTAEDFDNICDNITGKRWSPEAVQTARREELEFIETLAVLKEVPVEQRWLETNAKAIGTKWIDINKGDGDRVEIRSTLVAEELKVLQVKMGILHDDIFSATPPLEALRLFMILMMIESEIDIIRVHSHSPSRRRVYVGESGVGFLLNCMCGTRDAAANFAAIVMYTLTNMKFEVGSFNPCLCKDASKDIRLFYHGDDFVILAGERDMQWFAKELNEALIVKVRGVLGGD